jgi:hypothetical protein
MKKKSKNIKNKLKNVSKKIKHKSKQKLMKGQELIIKGGTKSKEKVKQNFTKETNQKRINKVNKTLSKRNLDLAESGIRKAKGFGSFIYGQLTEKPHKRK